MENAQLRTQYPSRPEKLGDMAEFNELAYYTCTDAYYKTLYTVNGHRLVYTDGVKYVAETANCYWLIDMVMAHTYTIYKNKRIDEDQKRLLVCRLAVGDNDHAVFQVTDGNDNILATQEIQYTDFPAKLFTIWVQNGVAMLPSEY